jgi:hypothetical protein
LFATIAGYAAEVAWGGRPFGSGGAGLGYQKDGLRASFPRYSNIPFKTVDPRLVILVERIF